MPCPARSPPAPQPSAAAPTLLLLSPLGCQELRVPGQVLTGTPGAGCEVRVPPAPRTALPLCFLFFCQPEAACVSGCF